MAEVAQLQALTHIITLDEQFFFAGLNSQLWPSTDKR